MGHRHRAAKLAASRLERSLAPTLLVLARPQGAGRKPALAGGQPVLPVWHGQLPGQPRTARPLALRQPASNLDFGHLLPHFRHRAAANRRARRFRGSHLWLALRRSRTGTVSYTHLTLPTNRE